MEVGVISGGLLSGKRSSPTTPTTRMRQTYWLLERHIGLAARQQLLQAHLILDHLCAPNGTVGETDSLLMMIMRVLMAKSQRSNRDEICTAIELNLERHGFVSRIQIHSGSAQWRSTTLLELFQLLKTYKMSLEEKTMSRTVRCINCCIHFILVDPSCISEILNCSSPHLGAPVLNLLLIDHYQAPREWLRLLVLGWSSVARISHSDRS